MKNVTASLVFFIVMSLALIQINTARAAQPGNGVINVATIGEPPTLDPMATTTDLAAEISQHIFETLFTFDSQWNVVPLLAEKMPEISAGGKQYDITLRKNVHFHDGRIMTPQDVAASLQRWLRIASRGKQVSSSVVAVTAQGDNQIRITLNRPYSPLLALLAFNNSAAVIMPQDVLADPLTRFIGTGPYRLQAHRPDQYIQLTRFDDYQPRQEAPDGYGGARHALLKEIRFVPVVDENTRLNGMLSGQFDYADSLPPEKLAALKGNDRVEPLLLKPFGLAVMVMNTREGVLANQWLRQAVQAALNPNDMLLAGFGDPNFVQADGALYPENFVWHSEQGVARYGKASPQTAAALMKKGNYQGQTLRILTSRQYEFHYKMALVAQAYLQAAGFKVSLEIFDWATLTTRRANPALWDIFITHGPFAPEPILNGWMADDYPGWWATPEKKQAVDAFITETDPQKRKALFAAIQTLFYEQAPVYKVGNFNTLSAKASTLANFTPSPWPFFWNVESLKKP
ncbi:ABC transporter substrate-binding protein [Brenneria izadpanahii]|uniref:ABC transporter substrate-binding protein n=1 Tax=Brenneria izadpanahii TaxID=2722756 RepID=A0ABX7UQ99_9GAMM|nr:ABC transporter substrate-binding protein [Brenneria izadpanahii]QTF06592.1 ABC transporter substrate-binding protein [Brenneria izadpanahii]